MANRLQLARCNLPHHLKTFVREQIAGRPAKFWKEIGPRFPPSCLKETTYTDHPHPINSERIPKVEPLQRFHPTAPNQAIHGHPASAPPCHWEAPALNWQGHFLVFKFGPPSWGHVSQHSREFLPIFFWGENHVNHYHFVLIETLAIPPLLGERHGTTLQVGSHLCSHHIAWVEPICLGHLGLAWCDENGDAT